jgi:xanthine dehydrogenase YagT iron-sulfur-binding subunit
MADECRRGVPSHVTQDLTTRVITLTREELRERMSGNLCRCGAYNGIIEAITQTVVADDLTDVDVDVPAGVDVAAAVDDIINVANVTNVGAETVEAAR